jgi:type II secretory pathway pseudopilin PulG
MKFNRFHRQSGATLMEVLVAMTISLVVTAAMVALMSNSLGTTARIIHMTRLGDDMRVTMQMMSRDLRRTSYNSRSMYCYGNEDCTEDGTVTAVGDIVLYDGDGDTEYDCLTFLTDRNLDDYQDATQIKAGGFRRIPIDGVGVMQMWTGGATPDCGADPDADGWVDITNTDDVDITSFEIDDSLTYEEIVLQDINGKIVRQKVRKLRMSLAGALVLDASINRHIEDIISVRNDLLIL